MRFPTEYLQKYHRYHLPKDHFVMNNKFFFQKGLYGPSYGGGYGAPYGGGYGGGYGGAYGGGYGGAYGGGYGYSNYQYGR